jgi:hypothetical protein
MTTTIRNMSINASVALAKTDGTGSGMPEVPILSGHNKGSTQITVTTAADYPPGTHVALSQLNDPQIPVSRSGYIGNCTWCAFDNGNRAMVQLAQVVARAGNTLTIDRPLYFTFRPELAPTIRRFFLIAGAGLEHLKVEQASAAAGTHNIFISGCDSCWVTNVESKDTWHAHIIVQGPARRVEVRDSFLNGARLVGSGRGYGLFVFDSANSDHLFENNIIYRSRHSIVMEGGGSGVVFAYNYSVEPLDDTRTWLENDMITHGAHPYMNLWESNSVVKMSLDHTWGSSSHNTAFRNHIRRYNIANGVLQTVGISAVDLQKNNHYINIVGNVLATPGAKGAGTALYRLGYNEPCCSNFTDPEVEGTLYLHGNFDFVQEITQWSGGNVDRTLPASLYLAAKPAFFGRRPWPAIGSDLEPKVSDIPAVDCYLAHAALGRFDANTCYRLSAPTQLQTR